jgi:hypothetical protein
MKELTAKEIASQISSKENTDGLNKQQFQDNLELLYTTLRIF